MRITLTAIFALLPLTAFAGQLDDQLVRGLSLRGSDAPSCEVLLTLGQHDDVRDALVRIADDVPRPPWVPMRAAGCVASLSGVDPVAYSAAQRWASQPDTPGFALVVLQRAESLPMSQALVLGKLAVKSAADSAQVERVAARLVQSPYSDVRGLAPAITK